MKKILLFTHNNNIFRDEFSDAGYIVKDIEQSVSDNEISKFAGKSFKGYIVIEIANEDTDRLNKYVELLNTVSAKTIILAPESTGSIRSFLFKHGIADLIVHKDVKRIVQYIDIIDKKNQSCFGKILILDDCKHRIDIIRAIITRFGYIPIFANTIDDLFNNLKETNIQLALVSLGAEGFDINEFIRRSYQSSEIKRFPIIPYKDSIDEILIHELLSGLNRVAKFILSSDELFSFLVDMLFKKELFPFLRMLNESAMYESMTQFSRESLNSICHSLMDDILSMDNLLQEDQLNKLVNIIDSIRNTIIKMDGLLWLRMENKTRDAIGLCEI